MNHNILPNNHYSLEIIPEIQELCQPLFKKHEINIFTYMRCFNDGSIYILMTHRDIYQHHLKSEYPLSPIIPDKILSSKFHYLVLPELQDGYDQAMRDHKNRFGLTAALYMYERFENYFDFYSYNSTNDHPTSINNLVHNIHEFDKYKCIFKDKAQKIITLSNRNKIIVPPHMRPNFCGVHTTTTNSKSFLNRHAIIINNKNSYLTPRELEVIKYLAQGCTAKEASKSSGLSHRTIENYLANIRTRLGIHKKHEIISAVGAAGLLT